MADKPRDHLALATKSQRLALIGAFCGSVLVGGLAAAFSDSSAWGIKGNAPPLLDAAIARSGESAVFRLASDGEVLLNARLMKSAVADLGLPKPAGTRAANAEFGFVEPRTVEIAEAAGPEPDRLPPS